jgi:hypothetical protein
MHNRVLAFLTALATLALLLSAPYVPRLFAATVCSGTLGTLGWQCEVVDSAGDVGVINHFVYGSDGAAHVAYTANIQLRGLKYATALKYARRDLNGTWTTQVVDSSLGGAHAMLINPVTGRPAIGYGCVSFAEFTGAAWTRQTVVKDCGNGTPSFVFDAAGTLHAAYGAKHTNRLVVGTRTGTSWSFQTLAPLVGWMSMAIAPDGLPSVAFDDRADGLVYGHQQPGGAWQFTKIDTASSLVARITLEFAPDGAATIASRIDDHVRVARQDPSSGAWAIETVYTPSSSVTDIAGLSLTFASGQPIVTFGTMTQPANIGTLFAARRDATGGWTRSSIEILGGSSVFQWSSVDYNPATGLLGVSYGPRGTSWNDLRFAEGSPDLIGS